MITAPVRGALWVHAPSRVVPPQPSEHLQNRRVSGNVSAGSSLKARDRAGARRLGRCLILVEVHAGIDIGFNALRHASSVSRLDGHCHRRTTRCGQTQQTARAPLLLACVGGPSHRVARQPTPRSSRSKSSVLLLVQRGARVVGLALPVLPRCSSAATFRSLHGALSLTVPSYCRRSPICERALVESVRCLAGRARLTRVRAAHAGAAIRPVTAAVVSRSAENRDG